MPKSLRYQVQIPASSDTIKSDVFEQMNQYWIRYIKNISSALHKTFFFNPSLLDLRYFDIDLDQNVKSFMYL
jgi:hypothetical protein